MIAFIDDHRDAYGVEPICRALPIALSICRDRAAWRAGPETRRHGRRGASDGTRRSRAASPRTLPSTARQRSGGSSREIGPAVRCTATRRRPAVSQLFLRRSDGRRYPPGRCVRDGGAFSSPTASTPTGPRALPSRWRHRGGIVRSPAPPSPAGEPASTSGSCVGRPPRPRPTRGLCGRAGLLRRSLHRAASPRAPVVDADPPRFPVRRRDARAAARPGRAPQR